MLDSPTLFGKFIQNYPHLEIPANEEYHPNKKKGKGTCGQVDDSSNSKTIVESHQVNEEVVESHSHINQEVSEAYSSRSSSRGDSEQPLQPLFQRGFLNKQEKKMSIS